MLEALSGISKVAESMPRKYGDREIDGRLAISVRTTAGTLSTTINYSRAHSILDICILC